MEVDSTEIEINGIRKDKTELAEIVCAKLTNDTVLDDELVDLLAKIVKATEWEHVNSSICNSDVG